MNHQSQMPTDPPLRRKWNITRWLVVLAVLGLGWSGWRVYAFRSALAEAKALGWEVEHTDPVETIRANWKAAFEKETWLDGVTEVDIPTSEAFEQNIVIVHRLNPKVLEIDNAATLRDLSALKNLSALRVLRVRPCTGLTDIHMLELLPSLQTVVLFDCTSLLTVDAFKNLSALENVRLDGCTGLTNVDALKNLSALQSVSLIGCTGLTKESVAALKAALPKAEIIGP